MNFNLSSYIFSICILFLFTNSTSIEAVENMDEDQLVESAAVKYRPLFMVNYFRGRINPVGASLNNLFYYRFSSDTNSHFLTKNNHIDVGVQNIISPAFECLLGHVVVEPVAFFDITAKAGVELHFDTFGYGVPLLPSKNSEIDRESLATYGRHGTDTAFVVSIAPRLKVKFGPVILAHQLNYMYHNYSTVFSGTIYHYTLDTRTEPEDSTFINSSYLLFQIGSNLLFGLSNDYLYVLSNGYNYDRMSIYGKYTWALAGNNQLEFSSFAGYYLVHEVYDFFFSLEISLTTKL